MKTLALVLVAVAALVLAGHWLGGRPGPGGRWPHAWWPSLLPSW